MHLPSLPQRQGVMIQGLILFDQAIDYFEVHSVGWVKQVAGEFVIFSIGKGIS